MTRNNIIYDTKYKSYTVTNHSLQNSKNNIVILSTIFKKFLQYLITFYHSNNMF